MAHNHNMGKYNNKRRIYKSFRNVISSNIWVISQCSLRKKQIKFWKLLLPVGSKPTLISLHTKLQIYITTSPVTLNLYCCEMWSVFKRTIDIVGVWVKPEKTCQREWRGRGDNYITRSLIIILCRKYYEGDTIKRRVVDMTCDTNKTDEKCVRNFSQTTWKQKTPLGRHRCRWETMWKDLTV